MDIVVPIKTDVNELCAVIWPAQSTQLYLPVSYLHLPVPPRYVPQRSGSAVSTVPPLLMPQVLLYGEIAPGWVITQPLVVTFERDEGGYYITSDAQFAVYGDGDTRVKALQDYIESLIDYYQLLAVRAESDPPTWALFRHLQSYLHPIAK